MEHNYFIAVWALSVMPALREDVVEHMTGVHRDAIERGVTKLQKLPCSNNSKEI